MHYMLFIIVPNTNKHVQSTTSALMSEHIEFFLLFLIFCSFNSLNKSIINGNLKIIAFVMYYIF